MSSVLGDLGMTIEVANQARVHLWYEAHFGRAYEPLHSARQGIDRFLVPATCVGVRPRELYAPNGLALLYEGGRVARLRAYAASASQLLLSAGDARRLEVVRGQRVRAVQASA